VLRPGGARFVTHTTEVSVKGLLGDRYGSMESAILARVRTAIPYVPALRDLAGTVAASVLVQQLEYWFERNPEGFYKFMSPNSNVMYRAGDSWTEELAMSDEEFRSSFDRIGVAHKSRTQFDSAPTPFSRDGVERLYCSFHDRRSGATWYYRNHRLADRKIGIIFMPKGSEGPRILETGEVGLQKPGTPVYRNQEPPVTETGNAGLPSLYGSETTAETTSNQSEAAPHAATARKRTPHARQPAGQGLFPDAGEPVAKPKPKKAGVADPLGNAANQVALVDYWCDRYLAVHDRRAVGDHQDPKGNYTLRYRGALGKSIQKLRHEIKDPDDIRRLLDLYLGSDDPFFAGHPLQRLTSDAQLANWIEKLYGTAKGRMDQGPAMQFNMSPEKEAEWDRIMAEPRKPWEHFIGGVVDADEDEAEAA
jgi:hypothetical protein